MFFLLNHKKYIIAIVSVVAVIFYAIYGLGFEESASLRRRYIGPKYKHARGAATDVVKKSKPGPSKSGRFIGKEFLSRISKQKGNIKKQKHLPNAIEIGVRKGGTRALLKALTLNPAIKVCSKEVHFFDREENYEKGLEWYRSRMPEVEDTPGQIVMEKTPAYFVTSKVPERVYNMSPSVKLLVVVRDPVRRAISDYSQLKARSPDMKAFESYVYDSEKDAIIVNEGFVRSGRYSEHLKEWRKFFPISQFHVVSGEKLVLDPVSELQDVERFLGLKSVITNDDFYFNKTKGFPCFRKKHVASGNQYACLGKTKGRKHPHVNEKVIQKLREYYRPYNKKFYDMVGRDFGWP